MNRFKDTMTYQELIEEMAYRVGLHDPDLTWAECLRQAEADYDEFTRDRDRYTDYEPDVFDRPWDIYEEEDERW